MATTPFDTIAAVLERRAVQSPGDAPVLLAIAAWCEVIRDDIVRARRLATQAVGALDASQPAHAGVTANAAQDSRVGQQAPIVQALAEVVEAFGGSKPFNHAVLERVADGFLHSESDEARRRTLQLAWMLEMPNWYTFSDRYPDAARILDSRLAALDPEPNGHERVSVWCCLAELEFRRGRWDSAQHSSLAAIDAALEIGDQAGYAHALAARIEAGRARQLACEAHVRAAWALSLTRGDHWTQWRVIGAEAFAAASESDWTRVRGLLEPLARRRCGTGVQLASVRLWDGDYVESLARLDDKDAARRHLDCLREENSSVPTRWTQGIIARGMALTARTPSEGIGSAEESVAVFDEMGAVFEAARSKLLLGELHHRCGRIEHANLALRSAALTFSSMGATAWLDRVDAVSASHPRHAGPPRAPEAFNVLTQQELEVAMKVIAGATNKEAAATLFVSVKTVETHITRIYRKLRVRSRAELVAAYFTGIHRP